ncbi:MAG: hypothetical protein COU31_00765 [Candidatus Magasanikbacteria bacterium CG10_big_fil_rev_8_21_14_0_10_40_10]|uniref:Uncharacterized protein n=1 Tax=Candidatus Magasanikbacteria bacterium CG10_big_fil_rev_8_21_14_0_10_40_10 TaxID=1974648 RepID=A0A2M6W4Y2_9BACT|nr:MAG: hypothetical protein COU31_00765 [Candidatus Magasanikbacteria bacterium CG10_big_fil_rev_8_21_14_0_10_40_10]
MKSEKTGNMDSSESKEYDEYNDLINEHLTNLKSITDELLALLAKNSDEENKTRLQELGIDAPELAQKLTTLANFVNSKE